MDLSSIKWETAQWQSQAVVHSLPIVSLLFSPTGEFCECLAYGICYGGKFLAEYRNLPAHYPIRKSHNFSYTVFETKTLKVATSAHIKVSNSNPWIYNYLHRKASIFKFYAYCCFHKEDTHKTPFMKYHLYCLTFLQKNITTMQIRSDWNIIWFRLEVLEIFHYTYGYSALLTKSLLYCYVYQG